MSRTSTLVLSALMLGASLRAHGQATPRSYQLDGSALLVPVPVTFLTGGVTLTPASDSALDHVAAYLAEKTYITVLRIEVHLDADGNAARAQALSQQRAYAIAMALVKRGVLCTRVLPIGFGDTKPLAPNDTPENRAKNRRVTFVNAALRGRPIGSMPVDGGGVNGGDPCST